MRRYLLDSGVAQAFDRCTVVTVDTDLAAVPGLPVENWAIATA